MKRAEIPIPVYEEQLRSWNPDQFDADEWADAVAASRCRYFVFTTKHHDGLAFFDRKVNPYTIVEHTAFEKGDIFGQLTATLPVTVTHERDWRWFRTEILGHVTLAARENQSIELGVTQPVDPAARVPFYLADDKPGAEHDGFMIKSITLKSLAPLPY